MNETPSRASLKEILAGDALEEVLCEDSFGDYVEVTPRLLAMLNLRDCKEQLERWKSEPLRLAQAAKSAHLAMQSALTDALAGPAGIGAYTDALRTEYLAYFDEAAPPPERDFVLPFPKLLARAMEQPMEWSGQKLEVSHNETKALEELTFVRHRVEHPRPQSHLIEPQFIARTLPVAARLTLELLDIGAHHYEDGERAAVESAVAAISALCAEID
ncbi:MAG TPA: hypothetical protein VIG90_12140 [Pedomonas sp.]|uniref:hypothetical protein n=1 Tax=Pedomonas sp. TaxID=2976421 RepID=UPI002F42B2CF